MGSDIDKKKFDQGHEQEQVRENDKRDYYGIGVGNDTRDLESLFRVYNIAGFQVKIQPALYDVVSTR
ncbi:hypothetical protein BPAE_0093g00210 [Botrytis paeoniae]|uniref:Uncharacterized protein n=1 Tax=Botrytis paeoniae TaxID=278948 RepID=A0A4Z1FMU2_9HELO|nr:hypothetical protein BPAE_0093g00210 [Botrytis paeoniae]